MAKFPSKGPAIHTAALALCALLIASPAIAEPAAQLPPLLPAEIFARAPDFEQASISPDGSHIAYAERAGDQHFVSVLPIAGQDRKTKTALPKDHQLNWVRWAGNDNLVISMKAPLDFFGQKSWTSFLTGLNIKTGKATKLSRDGQGLIGDDVIFIDPDGTYLLVSVAPKAIGEPKIFRVDITTSDQTEIENNRPYIQKWIADGQGNVRLGLGYADKKDVTYYRAVGEKRMRRISNAYDVNGPEGSLALRFDGGFGLENDGAAIATRNNGHATLHHFNFETSTLGEIIFANADYDVESFSRDQYDASLVSVRYHDSKLRTVWLKPELQKVQSELEQALAEQYVLITSRSRDNKSMIVESGSPSDPGSIYLYTTKGSRLHRIGGANDAIDPEMMGITQHIQYPARDGTMIPAYLTLPKGREPKNLPAIILPHDQPLTSRDSWKFKGMVQLLANRGYAVLQPNYRGSWGYGDRFTELGIGQIGKAIQDDLDDGMDWLVGQNIVDRSRICIVGNEYGGYAAIWGVTRNPDRYRCAAAFAPVLSINTRLKYEPQWLNGRFSRGMRDFVRKLDQGKETSFDPEFDRVSPTKSGKPLTRPVLIAYRREDLRQKEHFDEYTASLGKAASMVDELAFTDDDALGLAFFQNNRTWFERLEAFLAKHNPADAPVAGK